MAKRYRRHRRQTRNTHLQNIALLIFGGFVVAALLTNGTGTVSSSTILLIVILALLIAFVILGYAFFVDFRRQNALRLLDLAAVDTMPGIAFERWVGAQLRARSYKVNFTSINDYGVDIVAKKDGIKTAVQVKRYSSPLSQKPVREAVAGMKHYQCSRSMVVTNTYFTKAARVLAQSNNCELVDRDTLAQWLARSKSVTETIS